ncbi:PREDICTED: uncharacterized protein LOC106814680 [Priapulus caudatus]|uniref:Uncharacterized protein LOC106814680 n=1 Tax=Priapulus caudatus TaxID=37621 RepID=A0ABM1EQP0_PRICU|nr:PREDICTED: uncharacterized protein LOC106814680 [Priapulus caudatus]
MVGPASTAECPIPRICARLATGKISGVVVDFARELRVEIHNGNATVALATKVGQTKCAGIAAAAAAATTAGTDTATGLSSFYRGLGVKFVQSKSPLPPPRTPALMVGRGFTTASFVNAVARTSFAPPATVLMLGSRNVLLMAPILLGYDVTRERLLAARLLADTPVSRAFLAAAAGLAAAALTTTAALASSHDTRHLLCRGMYRTLWKRFGPAVATHAVWSVAIFSALEQARFVLSSGCVCAAERPRAGRFREEKRLMVLSHPQSL